MVIIAGALWSAWRVWRGRSPSLDGQRTVAAPGRLVGGNLRAAVFGANDGLISNASLILGIAGASADNAIILLSGAAGLMAGALGSVSPQLLARVRSALELANNRWNQWVMNYSRGQQFKLLQSLGVQAPTWQDLALALISLLCAGSLAAAGLRLGACWLAVRQARQRRAGDR